jgi:hypothetical protein
MYCFLAAKDSTSSCGGTPPSTAENQLCAASFIAPPKRGPIVKMPAANEETISRPARAVIMVLTAPETWGPWSIKSLSTVSTNSTTSFDLIFLPKNIDMRSSAKLVEALNSVKSEPKTSTFPSFSREIELMKSDFLRSPSSGFS